MENLEQQILELKAQIYDFVRNANYYNTQAQILEKKLNELEIRTNNMEHPKI